MIEPIIFDQRGDRIEVDHWPKDVAFSERFLDEVDPQRIRRDGDLVTITVDNGSAQYRLLDPLLGNDPLELRPIHAVLLVEASRGETGGGLVR